MHQLYENARKYRNDFEEIYYDDDISDEAFSMIHPNAKFRLSEVLRS